MSPDAAPRDAAACLLRDAIQLALRAHGYWRDERLWDQGHQLIYAVDVDVLVMYSAPQLNTQYASSFQTANRDADAELSRLLSRRIADHLFFRFAPSASEDPRSVQFALLPPHDSEWNSVVTAIANDLHRQGKHAGAKAGELFNDLDDLSASGIASYLENHAGQVLDLLDGASGAASQVRRLNELPPGKLVALARHPAWNGAPWLPPRSAAAGAAYEQLAEKVDFWYFEMKRQRDSGSTVASEHAAGEEKRDGMNERSNRMENLERDAWALARLEWMNERLATDGDGKKRLLLVTGTERMLAAAKLRAAPHDPARSFADTYLRHPLAFVGAKDFFAREGGGGPKAELRLRAWLAVLFPGVVKQQREASSYDVELDEDAIAAIVSPDSPVLSNALQSHLESDAEDSSGRRFPDDVLYEWSEVVRRTAVSQDHALPKRSRSEEWSKLLDVLLKEGNTASMRQRLAEALEDNVRIAFVGLFRSITELAVEQALAEERPMRGVPALRFDAHDDAEALRLYEAWCRQLWKERAKDRWEDVESLYVELRRTDPTHYRTTLMHAFVCSSAELWTQTRTLCRVALLLIQGIPEQQRGWRTGREAAYLLAVAERRMTRTPKGLQLAQEALLDAARRSGHPLEDDVRFRSEELSREVAALQLQRYIARSDAPVAQATALEFVERALSICAAVDPQRDSHSVQSWVVRQSVISGCVAAVLARACGSHSPQLTGKVRTLLEQLQARYLSPPLTPDDHEHQRWCDAISDFVYLVAVVLFGDGPRRLLARAALQVLEDCRRSKVEAPRQGRDVPAFEDARRAEFLLLALGPDGTAVGR